MNVKPKRAATPLLLAASLLLLAGTVAAAPQYPKMLQAEMDQGMLSVVRSFPAASGLTGWVLSQSGQYSLAYTTADGKTLLAGMLINEQGKDLSSEYEKKYIPQPDLSSQYQQLEQSAYIAEGTLKNPKKIVYVFTDANCTYCHTSWKALQPYEKVGLQVRWIPVAILGANSMPKAIEVMKAKDKSAAFRNMQAHYGKPWSAAEVNSEAVYPALAKQIHANTELMRIFNIAATPGMIWKDQQGQIQVKMGMPRLSEIPAITGLPEQKITDPTLLKYK